MERATRLFLISLTCVVAAILAITYMLIFRHNIRANQDGNTVSYKATSDDVEVSVLTNGTSRFVQLRNVSLDNARIAVPTEGLGYILDGKHRHDFYGQRVLIPEPHQWSYDSVVVLSPRMRWLHQLPENLWGTLEINTTNGFDPLLRAKYAKMLIHCWDTKISVSLSGNRDGRVDGVD